MNYLKKEMEGRNEELKENSYIAAGRGCCKVRDASASPAAISQVKCCKLKTHNWMSDMPEMASGNGLKVTEVRFKNGRKEFFQYPAEMNLADGEIVAVEAAPGHDIGIVSLTGELVRIQMRRKKVDTKASELKRVFRHARPSDVEKWFEALELEDTTMYRTRVIAMNLGLDMKINDVEYQGDKTKAIFYYTANERVDFRELIKKLAEAFRIRIEMKQIGVRQEAAKLGGIGSCGRELCCSSWMSSFHSVSTNSARVQQLSLNPQKLAGQCGKLKCCLNYEVDDYIDTLKQFPPTNTRLKTKKGEAFHQKNEVFKKVMWYAYANDSSNMMAIPIGKVKEIVRMNRKGKFPVDLESFALQSEQSGNVEHHDESELLNFI